MFRQLYVDNFKALRNFYVSLSPVNVFIGANAVGKSTILQAISFFKYFANDKSGLFLDERRWKGNELKSKLLGKRNSVYFGAEFLINNTVVLWDFSIVPKGDGVYSMREQVVDVNRGNILLNRDTRTTWWYDFLEDKKMEFPKFNLQGSMLSLIDTKGDPTNYERFPILSHLKDFLNGIESFELLAPEKMRNSSRNVSPDLGLGGERVASYIHGLPQAQKQRLNELLKKYYPYTERVNTVKKRMGWVDLGIVEHIPGNDPFEVNVKYLSDGLLRILFFAALCASENAHSTILLDEIEDGISPDLAAVLVNALIDISKEQNQQVFVTTHSPIILNYFNEEHVQYLYRNELGHVESSRLFEIPKLKQNLSFLRMGEVWASYGHEKLTQIIREAKQEETSNEIDSDPDHG